LIRALIFDRGSGLVFLLILAISPAIFSTAANLYAWVPPIFVAGIGFVFLAFYLLIKLFVPVYFPRFWTISGRAALVQCFQVIGALFIFMALGVEDNLMDYLVLFQISSIAIVVPVTMGGVGARELVFFYGPKFLAVDGNLGVVFSLLFFLAIAVSSLAGMFIQYDPRWERFSESNGGQVMGNE